MYNGIGILSVRGSGTSGYVQGNKFNLRGGRPVQSRFPDTAADKGPTQRQPDESILQHNQKRQIELKLIAEEEKLADQGLTEAEIDEKVAALRLQLEKADEVTPESEQRIADETHAMAKRKLAQMAKLRDVFGFTIEQDSKEGESFDRELQEQRKRDRLMEKELREKTKVKEARARAKEIRHKQREEKRAIKKAEKDRQKEEKARFKAQQLRQQQRDEERAAARQQAKLAEERARAIREAPPPERYVPRGPSPVRHNYSSESEDERLPLPPPARTRGRIASQIAPHSRQPPAADDRRSKSLSPDPVKTAVNHAEPPRHTKVASPPRRPRPDRSPSPPPKRRHVDYDGARPSSRRMGDASTRDSDRGPAYGEKYGSSRDRDNDSRARTRDTETAPYGDRGRRSEADGAPYGDRSHRSGAERPYGDRQLQRTHYEDSRYRDGDRASRERLARQRGTADHVSRGQETRRKADARSVSPPRRKPSDGKDSKRKRSPSSSSDGTSGSSSSGTSSSGSGSSTSGSSRSSSSDTSSSGRSQG